MDIKVALKPSHIRVPLKNLRFGHEAPVHPGNARVTGRTDGIAELAAHIFGRGKIDDLLIYDDGVPDIYFVANGNRSLAALRMIHTQESDELVDCKLTTPERAYEDSLAVAVLSRKFHPVDEYEGYATLIDQGKTKEEIAHQYGMTAREVEQVLALGHLSPTIRDAWRRGELKTEVARAFTLAADHKAQDDVLAALTAGHMGSSDIDDHDVKRALKISHDECGRLVEFVGFDAYVARGGKVTRYLFGTDHQVSDAKLVKKMAGEKLAEECEKLKTAGWSFAVTADSVRNTKHDFSRLKIEAMPTDEERDRLRELNITFSRGEVSEGFYYADEFAELTGPEQWAFTEYHQLKRAIDLRAYTPKMMEKAGCFVGIDQDGFLEIEFGWVKPAKKEAAAEVVKSEKKEQKKAAAKTAKEEGKPPPASTTLSHAQTLRLESELIAATRDAIGGDPDLVNSPLFEMLAKVVCAQIIPDSPFRMPDAVRTKLPSLRQILNVGVFNAALANRFDADDYFGSAPKGLIIKALAEAINPDEARKAATGHATTADFRKFALINVAKTGWLPKELRTVHYKGPGSEGYKKPSVAEPQKPAPVPAAAPTKPATTADKVKQAKAERETKRNGVVMKRAASAKKSAKKTSKKKR